MGAVGCWFWLAGMLVVVDRLRLVGPMLEIRSLCLAWFWYCAVSFCGFARARFLNFSGGFVFDFLRDCPFRFVDVSTGFWPCCHV